MERNGLVVEYVLTELSLLVFLVLLQIIMIKKKTEFNRCSGSAWSVLYPRVSKSQYTKDLQVSTGLGAKMYIVGLHSY